MDQGYLPGDELVELYNKNSPTLLILKQVKHGPLYNIILSSKFYYGRVPELENFCIICSLLFSDYICI